MSSMTSSGGSFDDDRPDLLFNFALSARDCTSGYRCWRRQALASLPLDQFISDGYSFLVSFKGSFLEGLEVVFIMITFIRAARRA